MKYCLCWPGPINGMWEGLWEKGKAGRGFPGGGRDWHVSPGVHMSAKVGVCCGLCPRRAGHGECSWECCTHQQAPACAPQAPLCSVPLGDFHCPLPWERCVTTPSEPERSCPSLAGSTGVSQPLPHHPPKSPHVNKCRLVAELIILAVYKAVKGRGHVSDYTANKPWQITNISKVVPINCNDPQERAPRITPPPLAGVLHLGTEQ